MDPQQRLMLELAWEALEDAGVLPAELAGTRTGVFVGAMADEYAALLARRGTGAANQHTFAGTARGVIANRVSHRLGLTGPSLTVDAAQASSLVAVHLAAESLRRGESTLALAGGVNLVIGTEGDELAARFGALSPDGRCHTFDAGANGFARGSGGGFVVLKPLARALADGDRIYCVVLGTAVNNDGATESLTVPDADAQAAAIRDACAAAGVEPAQVQYVELHGTGTRVGDPIEARGLGTALGPAARAGREPLAVGSAKTNVGHLEGAAGFVGLLKTALSIRARQLPASLNYRTPNPDIDLVALGLRVQTELGPWPEPERALIAGVSSFGMGGTNCHAVLCEAPGGTSGDQADAAGEPPVTAWPVSGRDPRALRAQAQALREHLESAPEASATDVAW